jgi:uncharacterized protein (TIRG00374 family)
MIVEKNQRRYTSIVSLLVAALLLIILFRWVDTQEFNQQFKSLLAGMDSRWLAVYVLLSLSGILLRGERYRLLLDRKDISLWNFFWVVAIRNVFVDLFPARSGALSYIYVLKKRFRIPVASGASTMILAMLFDYVVFAPVLMVAIALSASDVGLPSLYLMAISLLLLLVMVFLVVGLESFLGMSVRLINALSGRREGRTGGWMEKLAGGIESLQKDLSRIKGQKGIYWKLAVLSFFIRGSKYAAIYFLLSALLQGEGYTIGSLVFTQVLLGTAVAEMSALLPIHTPAGLGSWDMAWTLAFVALGFGKEMALASGLAVHLISKVMEYSLGCVGILLLFVRRS